MGVVLNNSFGSTTSDFENDFGNAVQRIHYLLCQFVETISSTSIVSVTLCLDDVQWIDKASISVMRHVLTQAYKKFFFLACCRHEMCNTHPFWSMIESVRSNGILSSTVELKNVDVNMLTSAMSDLLCLSPRVVKPLASIVHNKTNVFLFLYLKCCGH